MLYDFTFVTSFSVFHTEATVSIGLKNVLSQSGNIHSTELDVYVVKQSVLDLSLILSQHKQGRKYYAFASSPLTTRQNWYDTCFKVY